MKLGNVSRWAAGLLCCLVLTLPTETAAAHHDPAPPGVAADNMYPTDNDSAPPLCTPGFNLCQADGILHTYYFDPSMTFMKGAFRDRATDWSINNDLIFLEWPSVVPGLDVIITEGPETLLPGAYAGVECVAIKVSTFHDCDTFVLHVNLDRITGDGLGWGGFKKIACHEFGHTMGLTHGSNAEPSQNDWMRSFRCMKTGVFPRWKAMAAVITTTS